MVSKTTKPPLAPPADAVDDPTIYYPSSDGSRIAETDWQYVPLTDTVSTLRIQYRNRPDVYVAGNMLIYYRMNRNDIRVAPDVFAVFGANGNHRRDSWLVWREGGKTPSFVMEVASASTWRRDANAKRDIYADMGVTEYVRFDPTGRLFTPALIMETLHGTAYRQQPLATDADGILRGYSAVLELEFCVTPTLELRLYDPATGEWLRTHQESEAARHAEADARHAAEAEVTRLQAELRRLRRQQ